MTVIDAAQWASPGEPGGQDMPNAFQPDRLRELRTEAGWSQAELAERIDSDGRQVSRYEGGKVAPGLDAVVRIAEVFNVSVDYLVIPDATRRPLHQADPIADEFSTRLPDLAALDPTDRAAVLKVLDAFVTKSKLRAIAG
jgi:transcriptional regulator with XRE-family HTH domain